jgi:hypothetical protein
MVEHAFNELNVDEWHGNPFSIASRRVEEVRRARAGMPLGTVARPVQKMNLASTETELAVPAGKGVSSHLCEVQEAP